ncbi:hypothetical protein QJS10_CPB11g01502 [Acorus calamus]|uniref:Uncharacterized protein n=1 Tax=Acorus calamus TaxID=4465 RepID=A0AAV9DX44_ACOCL|nr:hypothetical protein QJS10_CPB11g01502 [Acorus calamus]
MSHTLGSRAAEGDGADDVDDDAFNMLWFDLEEREVLVADSGNGEHRVGEASGSRGGTPHRRSSTDFGIVSIEDRCGGTLSRRIRRLRLVRDVTVDLSNTRGFFFEGGRSENGGPTTGRKVLKTVGDVGVVGVSKEAEGEVGVLEARWARAS